MPTLPGHGKHRSFVLAFAAVFLVAATLTTAAHGDDIGQVLQEVRSLRERVDAQETELQRQRQIIENQQAELAQWKSRAVSDASAYDAEQTRTMVADALAQAVAELEQPQSVLAGWDKGFYLASPDGNYKLNIGGVIQPRYEFHESSDSENTSSFYMRRV
jgi:hypothetical protein